MLHRFETLSTAASCIHRTITKIEREEMVKVGYKGIYAPCLVAMKRSPDGITAAALCKVCDKDKASVSRIIGEMEKLGLIFRVGEKNLYRARLLLTPKGQKVAEYVCRKAVAAVALAGEGLSQEDRAVFYRCLTRIASNIQKIERTGIPGHIEL